MNPVIKFIAFVLLTGVLFCISCKREYSCETCNAKDQPPIANAGNDTSIILPNDNFALDGSLSSDPDGKISAYQWTEISGPSIDIANPTAAKPMIKKLLKGIYSFELQVTDDKGLSAKDTVVITVNSKLNAPPIAKAGSDQSIILPANNIFIDGSSSTDPDNNISGYQWKQISGPASGNISNADSAKTPVINLAEGIYQFELTVTDSTGLFSKDTVEITITGECTTVAAHLNPFATISEPRWGMVTAAAGNKIIFAGGYTGNAASTRVDIYDISTNAWSTAELSISRESIVAGSIGGKIFIAGGSLGGGLYSTRVDIYDADNNSWSTAELSKERSSIATASVGNKILFGGGYNVGGSDRVDIYDNSTGTWSMASLSQPRWGLSATASGDKIYFAGGEARDQNGPGFGGSNIVNTIDIYDASANSWSVSSLGESKGYMPAIAIDEKIYLAGGSSYIDEATQNYAFSNKVEIKDINQNTSSFVQLCEPVAGTNAVAIHVNDDILFFSGIGFLQNITADKYNISSNKWSKLAIDKNLYGSSIISSGNTIYIAGGFLNGYNSTVSNQVWKLEF